MAAEIQISASLQFAKGNISSKQLLVNGINADVAGSNFIWFSQIIPTTAGGTAIKLGGLTNIGWILLVNRDATNFVKVLTATSGTVFGRMLANGEPCHLRLDPTITAPALLADTAPCLVEGFLVEI
jgi:hypothetical protein